MPRRGTWGATSDSGTAGAKSQSYYRHGKEHVTYFATAGSQLYEQPFFPTGIHELAFDVPRKRYELQQTE